MIMNFPFGQHTAPAFSLFVAHGICTLIFFDKPQYTWLWDLVLVNIYKPLVHFCKLPSLWIIYDLNVNIPGRRIFTHYFMITVCDYICKVYNYSSKSSYCVHSVAKFLSHFISLRYVSMMEVERSVWWLCFFYFLLLWYLVCKLMLFSISELKLNTLMVCIKYFLNIYQTTVQQNILFLSNGISVSGTKYAKSSSFIYEQIIFQKWSNDCCMSLESMDVMQHANWFLVL
jgi:hypothetical protein